MSFNNMGKPIPEERKDKSYKYCKSIGMEQDTAISCVNTVANFIEQDRPAEAQKHAMEYLDLTGTYRLIATLLT